MGKSTENPTFSKAQLMQSKRYAGVRDLIGALLSDEESYTLKAVDKLINDYMGGKPPANESEA